MKRNSVPRIAISIALVLLSMGGFAMAATTTTGSMSDSATLVWTTSTGGAIDGVLVPGERQSTTVYGENTQASGGTSWYSRSLDLNTAPRTFGQYNVDSFKMFTFDGISQNRTGKASSDEFIGIDTMGRPNSSPVTIDPFVTPGISPAYHNQVNAGSAFDLEQGSLVTQARTRTITPRADVPVTLDYIVGLQGLNEKPAVGAASAFIDGHLEQGGQNCTGKTMDIVFSDESTASGLIYRFDKSMLYESGSSTLSVF
jgi:hypothetical protein